MSENLLNDATVAQEKPRYDSAFALVWMLLGVAAMANFAAAAGKCASRGWWPTALGDGSRMS